MEKECECVVVVREKEEEEATGWVGLGLIPREILDREGTNFGLREG